MKRTLLSSFLVLMIFGQSFTSAAAVVTTSKATDENATSTAAPAVPAVDAVSGAMAEFKSLSKGEKKNRFKEVKKEIKRFKAEKKAGNDVSTNTLLLVLLAILVPPLAVYLHEGETNTKFWINVILTILGFVLFGSFGTIFLGSILGIVHALLVILGN